MGIFRPPSLDHPSTPVTLYFSEHLSLIKIIFYLNIYFLLSLPFLEYMLHETKDIVFLISYYE